MFKTRKEVPVTCTYNPALCSAGVARGAPQQAQGQTTKSGLRAMAQAQKYPSILHSAKALVKMYLWEFVTPKK